MIFIYFFLSTFFMCALSSIISLVGRRFLRVPLLTCISVHKSIGGRINDILQISLAQFSSYILSSRVCWGWLCCYCLFLSPTIQFFFDDFDFPFLIAPKALFVTYTIAFLNKFFIQYPYLIMINECFSLYEKAKVFIFEMRGVHLYEIKLPIHIK